MAGVTGRSGGTRNGAGRKPRADKFLAFTSQADQLAAGSLEENIETLQALASGGYERVTKFYEAAGLLFVPAFEPILDEDGEPTGKTRKIMKPAFPDEDPERMILVKKTVSYADGNAAAAMYLIDRIMGRPGSDVGDVEETERNVGLDLRELDADDLATLERLYAKYRPAALGGPPGGEGETQPG